MANQPFELAVGIETKPAKAMDQLVDSFDRAYKGERGTDETKLEFMFRKIEEYAQGIHVRMVVEDYTSSNVRNFQKDTTAGVIIRQRKDLPIEENELGENDPTMMPQVEAQSSAKTIGKNSARKRR